MIGETINLVSSVFFKRGECTETLRSRIRELEAEGKKLTMDMKVKEEQIRELELKVQVRRRWEGPSITQSPPACQCMCSSVDQHLTPDLCLIIYTEGDLKFQPCSV